MSTRIFETPEYSITEFWGGKDKGISLQLTPQNPMHIGKQGDWIALDVNEVRELIKQLAEWLVKIDTK